MAGNISEFREIVFAEDLNCFKDFNVHFQNETLHAAMDRCQNELHKMGKANQVSFDPVKKSQHILALNGGEGINFKLVGIPFDNALTMRNAVIQLVA